MIHFYIFFGIFLKNFEKLKNENKFCTRFKVEICLQKKKNFSILLYLRKRYLLNVFTRFILYFIKTILNFIFDNNKLFRIKLQVCFKRNSKDMFPYITYYRPLNIIKIKNHICMIYQIFIKHV